MTIAAIIIGFFFAMNIGASGAAASMGISYGAGVIKRRTALLLCAAAVFLGAYLGGGEVVKTLGSGIVPSETFTPSITVVVLLSAGLSLFLANIFGIPLSTSEVAVGSIVGAGLVYQAIYVGNLLWVMSFWVITPFVAFLLALAGRSILSNKRIHSFLTTKKAAPILAFLVVFAGAFEAFSAGMNNVANAVGPIVGAGMMSVESGIFYGGIFVALGALFLGHRVLETNGKKITDLRLEEGIIISGNGAVIVFTASLFGIPVPLAQITTSSIIGIGFAKQGKQVFQREIVARLLTVWIVSPVLSMVLTYTLIHLVIIQNLYPIIAVFGVIILAFGLVFLYKGKVLEWVLSSKKAKDPSAFDKY